jgi:hypothetical protein
LAGVDGFDLPINRSKNPMFSFKAWVAADGEWFIGEDLSSGLS